MRTMFYLLINRELYLHIYYLGAEQGFVGLTKKERIMNKTCNHFDMYSEYKRSYRMYAPMKFRGDYT